MSDTVDSIIRVLAEEYWVSHTNSGHTVFPLRAGKNGFAAPGKALIIREDKKQPEIPVAQILSKGGRAVREEKAIFGKTGPVVRFARETLRQWGVPLKPEEDLPRDASHPADVPSSRF